MQKYSNITEARAANRGIYIVWYPFQLGGQLRDRWMWEVEKDGEAIDYNSKAALLAQYQNAALLTIHSDGSVSAQHCVERTQEQRRSH